MSDGPNITYLALRFVPTQRLLLDLQGWRWTLAEIEASPDTWDHVESTRAYVRAKIDVFSEEIERRKTVRHMPSAPAWPVSPEDRRALWAEIKGRLTMKDVVERYAPVRFHQQGNRLVCRCPFPHHPDDDTPSFMVYPAQESFYCYGCKTGGDIFEFVRHYLAISLFADAADVLRVMASIPLPEPPAPVVPPSRPMQRRVAPNGAFEFRNGQVVARG